ncbi:MAG TPA: tetratricopeptide repeat protein [Thermoanaerobaculaceae bacterium]|nr:tetratricopeptide repeat protein [Thermoanaerobaculaceae bacterium]HRS17126.1 tetratricopeptide repeat protein [Thermoanaerobaculaceae bacterium]
MVDNSKRIDELKRELAKDPRSRQFYQLGELLRRDGRLGEAAEVLRGGLKYHVRYVAAWVALGRTCLDLGHGKESEAADALTQALGLDAHNPVAWRLLGEARLACGQRSAALEAMERALALVPGDEVLKAAVDALKADVERTAAPPSRPAEPAPPPPAAAAQVPEPAPAPVPFEFDAAPLPLEPTPSPVPPEESPAPEAPTPAEAGLGEAAPALEPLPAVPAEGLVGEPAGEVFDVFGEPLLAPAEPVVAAEAVAASGEEAVAEAHAPAGGAVLAEPAPELPPAAPETAPPEVEGAGEAVAPAAEEAAGAAAALEALPPEPPAQPAAPPEFVEVARPTAAVAVPEEADAPPAQAPAEESEPPAAAVAPAAEAPPAVEPAADAHPPASLTLARLYLRQQQMEAAIEVLETLLRREPDNQEARELLGLVRDMMDEAPPVSAPTLTPSERKIASLQRWLARVAAGRERIAR